MDVALIVGLVAAAGNVVAIVTAIAKSGKGRGLETAKLSAVLENTVELKSDVKEIRAEIKEMQLYDAAEAAKICNIQECLKDLKPKVYDHEKRIPQLEHELMVLKNMRGRN